MIIGKERKEFFEKTIIGNKASGITTDQLLILFRFYLGIFRSPTKVNNAGIFLPLLILFLEVKGWDYLAEPKRYGTLIRGIGFLTPEHQELANVLSQGIMASDEASASIKELSKKCYEVENGIS